MRKTLPDVAADIWFGKAKNMEAQLAEANKRVGELETVLDYHQKQHRIAVERAEQAEARIAELEKINNELSGDSYHSMPTGHGRDSAEVRTYIEELMGELAEAKSALSAMEARHSRLGDAAINGILTGMETVSDAHARIASLEKSVTVLRAENVELREIASGLSYYADGHGLQEKWAAELRALNQRLAALAQVGHQCAVPFVFGGDSVFGSG